MDFVCWKCKENIGGAVEPEDRLCDDEVETVRVFTYLGDEICASGGCDAALSASTGFL